MKIAFKFSVLLALVSAVGSAPPAHAQGYPVKEITAVCPFAAGTGADIRCAISARSSVKFWANR
jgi:tripartite-type tricarboxylate transporter receptor subunit TctC